MVTIVYLNFKLPSLFNFELSGRQSRFSLEADFWYINNFKCMLSVNNLAHSVTPLYFIAIF